MNAYPPPEGRGCGTIATAVVLAVFTWPVAFFCFVMADRNICLGDCFPGLKPQGIDVRWAIGAVIFASLPFVYWWLCRPEDD